MKENIRPFLVDILESVEKIEEYTFLKWKAS